MVDLSGYEAVEAQLEMIRNKKGLTDMSMPVLKVSIEFQLLLRATKVNVRVQDNKPDGVIVENVDGKVFPLHFIKGIIRLENMQVNHFS